MLARALAKDPCDRFGSLAEMAAALDRIELPAAERERPSGPSPAEALLARVLDRIGADGALLASGLPEAPRGSVNYGAAGIAYALLPARRRRGRTPGSSRSPTSGRPGPCATRTARTPSTTRRSRSPPRSWAGSPPYHTASGLLCVQALVSHALGFAGSQREAVGAFLQRADEPCDESGHHPGPLRPAARGLHAPGHPDRGVERRPPGASQDPGRRAPGGSLDGAGRRAPHRPLRPAAEPRDRPRLGRLSLRRPALVPLGRHGASRPPERPPRRAGRAGPALGTRPALALDRRRGRAPPGRRLHAGLVQRQRRLRLPLDPGPPRAGRSRLPDLAEGAAWNAWEAGDGGGSLCCGLGGRAYALLNLHRHTGGREWLDRARDLANRAAQDVERASEREDSLYKGKIGVALLAADLAHPETAAMPFFEEEGW